jgi:tetratricopeptide (TPR) repeat protein
MSDRIYIAPQHVDSKQFGHDWETIQKLNIQRLARVLDLKTTIAFLGSGCSRPLGYPSWEDLVQVESGHRLEGLNGKEAKEQAIRFVGAPSILDLLDDQDTVYTQVIQQFHRYSTPPYSNPKDNPYNELLDFTIRRFITTNYDTEMERALIERRGSGWTENAKSFQQEDSRSSALFSLARGPKNEYMVFHCHGRLPAPGQTKRNPCIVLTERNYKHWYLDENGSVFRDALGVTLQSNPLLVLGYSFNDPDLARVFRDLSTQRDRSWEIIVVLDVTDATPDNREAILMAQQRRLGASVISLDRGKVERKSGGSTSVTFQRTLASELATIHKQCNEIIDRWRDQPKTQKIPHTGYALGAPSSGTPDALFQNLEDDSLLQDIEDRFRAGHSVVSLSGAFGSAKYTKACQFLRRKYVVDNYTPVPFSAHANQDIYSYLKRLTFAASNALSPKTPQSPEYLASTNIEDVTLELRSVLEANSEGKKPLLLLISGIERFFDPPVDETGFRPRNKVAAQFKDLLDVWAKHRNRKSRILLTTRFNCAPLKPEAVLEISPRDQRAPFHHLQLELSPEELKRLQWELADQGLALPIAAAWITDRGGNKPIKDDQRKERLEALLREVHSAPSERGTRVARHIIGQLDYKNEPLHGETLNALSAFSRPMVEEVLEVCFDRYIDQPGLSQARPDAVQRRKIVLDNLKRFRLLEHLEAQPSTEPSERRFVVSPLVKRYCQVHRARRTPVEGRSFGLNGYGARGPFADPGQDHAMLQNLFRKFCLLAEKELEEQAKPGPNQRARRFIRAAFEILRSNYCCNTVTRWGKYSDFLCMVTTCFDLIKYYGQQSHGLWSPGINRDQPEHEDACVTTEEVIWLLNEIALAHYSSGAIQDAIRVWGLAFDWRELVKVTDPQQAALYGASLHCHMGMAYIHIGQLGVAEDYFRASHDDAIEAGSDDMTIRLRGMLARVRNLRGDLPRADAEYREVIAALADKNLRAQCYYLRFHGLLKARMGNYKEAEEQIVTSMNVAASQNHPDVREYARALLGRIYAEQKGPHLSAALREYDVALRYAKDKEMRILEAEATLGMASVQLELGDSSAALYRGFEALKIANECILALRQVEALTIIGRAFAAQGKTTAARDYLGLARDLAAHCEYRLHERDIDQVLRALPVVS